MTKKTVSLAFAFALAYCAAATPRFDTNSIERRHDILLLKDSGGIQSAVLTWPWPVGRSAPDSEFGTSRSSLQSAQERFNANYTKEGQLGFRQSEVSIALSSSTLPFRSFGSQPREQFEASLSQAWLSEWVAGNISLTYADQPSDGDDFRLDGSYLAVALGNWSFGLDQVDRWWGPGWDGSLILTNNARPVPALSLTRISPDAFETKWLHWIGPWTFTSFIGQLDNDEGERPGSDARLFGMRIDFSPFGWKNVDIGLSRTAQWAGKGRPGDLHTFWKILVSEDNIVAGSNTNAANEPGNQLAGADYRIRIPGFNIAQYGQIVGEDEDGYLPDANMIMGGVEAWGEMRSLDASWRAYFEWADTRAGYLLADPDSGHRTNRAFNIAYNHHIYRADGYRRHGQAIGHAVDGDGIMRSVGTFLVQDNGNLWGAKLRNYSLNRDGLGPNSVATDHVEGYSVEVFAELRTIRFMDWMGNRQASIGKTKLNAGLHYLDEENQQTGQSNSDLGGRLSITTEF